MKNYRLLSLLGVAGVLALGPVASAQEPDRVALLDPASLNETAPEKYQVNFDTSTGTFVVEVTREWAPRASDRFYNLVKAGYFDGCRFFRVISNFMVQFGIHGDPEVSAAWLPEQLSPDPVEEGNRRGFITFAMGGSPSMMTTQVFINFSNNRNLDPLGFASFGRVVSGMDVVDSIYGGYGDFPPRGDGPSPADMASEGNAYLEREFPRLDYINAATIVE